MKRIHFLLLLPLLANAFSAHAKLVAPSQFDLSILGDYSSENYRIGDLWGKEEVTKSTFEQGTDVYRRTALAAIKLGGGTAFYLGKFDNRHIIATNYHVCPEKDSCTTGGEVDIQAYFPIQGKRYNLVQWFGSWNAIDLALLEIQVPASDEAEMAKIAGPFKWDYEFITGTKLLSIGFGIADNPKRNMVAAYDRDCIIFSDDNEFRFMADPDDVNPAPYKAWSFAHGCDTSHGDSGSSVVDRKTGEVVGIVWTGRIPKSKSVQSSKYLTEILNNNDEEIWEELNYGVPAPKMKVILTEWMKGNNRPPVTVSVLKAMLWPKSSSSQHRR